MRSTLIEITPPPFVTPSLPKGASDREDKHDPTDIAAIGWRGRRVEQCGTASARPSMRDSLRTSACDELLTALSIAHESCVSTC